MSILSDTTEEKVIAILADCMLLFEKLYYLHMTARDAANARTAENTIRSIIENNGFQVVYRPGKKAKSCRHKNICKLSKINNDDNQRP